MDSQEHRRNLIKIKDDAQNVIRTGRFRGLVKDFLRRYKHWQEKMAECQEVAKLNPALIIGKDKKPGEPPKPRWEVETRDEYLLYVNEFNRQYGINGTFRRKFWRPQLPLNPVEILMPVDSFYRVIQQDDNLTPDRPRDGIKNDKERLVAHAFLIAVVCYKLSDGIIGIELPDDPTDDVWGYYGEIDNIHEYHRGDKTRSKLRDALTDVKYACTDVTQSETKQETKRSVFMTDAESSKNNWEAIKNGYGISKKDFGKKINFVKEQYKRKVIFRDVEDAFVLASQGFAKPAIILAGGVIEELLRLYLEHKKVPAERNDFFHYIKACKEQKQPLLKSGISKLSDSVREFRNLVHLAEETEKKHTITKSTAIGAVSSIFTIANDFQ
jgi:hypothetical protein